MDLYYDYPHVYDSGGYQHVPNYVNETYPIPYQGNVNYDERQIGFPQLFPGIFGHHKVPLVLARQLAHHLVHQLEHREAHHLDRHLPLFHNNSKQVYLRLTLEV